MRPVQSTGKRHAAQRHRSKVLGVGWLCGVGAVLWVVALGFVFACEFDASSPSGNPDAND